MTGDGGAVLVDPVVARRAVLDRRRALLDSARLFSCAVALGVAAAVLASIVFVPLMFARPGLATLPVLAASFGGAGGAVAHLLGSWRPGGAGGPLAIGVGSMLGALVGVVPMWLVARPWLPEPMPTVIGPFAVVCWVGGAVAIAFVAWAWSRWRARRVLPEPGPSLVAFLAAVVVACAAFGLLAAATAAEHPSPEHGPEAVGQRQSQPPRADGGSGFPGEEPQLSVDAPSLEEARLQFAALAESTMAAVGTDAIWREPQGLVVTEAACEGGVVLTLDGEFAMGVITDTTTDEHDRAVIDDNVAAAERVGAAWRELGMSGPEPLHGEQHFGGGILGGVEHAVVAFDFGVAQPHIDGHCVLPAG